MVAPLPLARAIRARPRNGFHCRERGSLLIVAMIISAIIGISLVSYIKLSTTSLQLADRSFHQVSALNLAEMGLEEALHCLNRIGTTSNALDAWKVANIEWKEDGASISTTLTLPAGTLTGGAEGAVKVYCSNYDPKNLRPVVVARARITVPRGPPVEKWVLARLRRRSVWANGMVARNSIVWSGGNATADSWNSDHDNNPSSPGVAYASANGAPKPGATVGTPSAANGAIDVGNGTIRGEVMSGGGQVLHSTNNSVLSDSMKGTEWNNNLVSSDFIATFPTIQVPSPDLLNPVNTTTDPIVFGTTLPRVPDKPATDGVYYYDLPANYTVKSNGSTLTIDGPVVFLAAKQSPLTNTVDLGGTAKIEVTTKGSLTIYTGGNIEAAGGGMINATSTPSALRIYGTGTNTGQRITFNGTASAIAAIYAPYATFELKGGGDLYGAVVANAISMNGTCEFHYDEALGASAGGNSYGIEQWRELRTPEDRADYQDKLAF